MRIVLLLAAVAAAVAFAMHFGAGDASFAAGFWRLRGDLDEMLILGGVGLAAMRASGRARSITFALALGGVALSAYLTARGLELPDMRLATVLALLLIGLLGAGSGAWLDYLTPFAALAALLVGHAATDARPSSDFGFLAGLSLAAAALLALGALIHEAAEALDAGLARRVAAAVAGVGAYLLTRDFLL